MKMRMSMLTIAWVSGLWCICGAAEKTKLYTDPQGKTVQYKTQAPDTLDLAERASLAVNALTGTADPLSNYESFQCGHVDLNPPYFSRRCAGPCLPKPVHVLPMMRIMSGSALNADMDKKMLDAMLSDIDENGLWIIKPEGRPWRAESYLNSDQFWSMPNGRLMLALLTWHEITGDPQYLKLVGGIARGLRRQASVNGDRAWLNSSEPGIPLAAMAEDTGARKTATEDNGSEPKREAFDGQGVAIRGLARYAALTGDRPALELAGQLTRFMLKPSMWKPSSESPVMIAGIEHGLWEGHFHTRTTAMMGILEYAIAAKDVAMQRFVREWYEYTRKFGIARIGFYPGVLGTRTLMEANKKTYGGAGQVCEGCSIGDMTWLAVRMSEEGIGDFWEDVDQNVRNQLVEHQLLRRDLIEKLIAGTPAKKIDPRLEITDNVAERNIGAFVSISEPTMLFGWWTMCCNANMPQGMYKAWDAIVRWQNGTATVNLLLNRASPWVDVDSYLPYEGKVVLKNKTAKRLLVRVPMWVDKAGVRGRIGNRSFDNIWAAGNYLMIEPVAAGDIVTIEFPMVETTETWTLPTFDMTYTCHFKGNTLVDIAPRPEQPHWNRMMDDAGAWFEVKQGYPIYLRDKLKSNKAPMKTITRYASSGMRLP